MGSDLDPQSGFANRLSTRIYVPPVEADLLLEFAQSANSTLGYIVDKPGSFAGGKTPEVIAAKR